MAQAEQWEARDGYRIASFVVRDDVFDQNHRSAPAFSAGGQIYLRETLPERGRGTFVAHEAGHVMKQVGYAPYLDFVERTPEMLDMGSADARDLLEGIAGHCGIDLGEMTDGEVQTLYDELNATVYGAIAAKDEVSLRRIASAFQDFDSYVAELTAVHEGFRESRRAGGDGGDGGDGLPRRDAPRSDGGDGGDGLPRRASPPRSDKRDDAPRSDGGGEMDRFAAAAAAFGESGRRALGQVYDERRDKPEVYGGFATYYQAGLSGLDQGKVKGPYAGALSQQQRFAAYVAGQNDAAASLAEEKRAAQFAPVAGTDSGLVYDDYVSGALDRETADRVNAVAKLLGTRVRFVDSVRGGTANAQISGSEVLVERGNPNPVLFLLGHEWTHRLQELAPEQYRKFRDAVAREVQGEAHVLLERYRSVGEGMGYERALDEAAAVNAEMILQENAEQIM